MSTACNAAVNDEAASRQSSGNRRVRQHDHSYDYHKNKVICTHVQTVDTRPLFRGVCGLGTRLDGNTTTLTVLRESLALPPGIPAFCRLCLPLSGSSGRRRWCPTRCCSRSRHAPPGRCFRPPAVPGRGLPERLHRGGQSFRSLVSPIQAHP